MAAFGSGVMGADPLAEARAKEMERKRAQTQRNIELIGQGQNAFGKGVGALSTVAGEHLGAAVANMFGAQPKVSPEVAAARQQAALLEQINTIEGDRAGSEWARKAGQKALEMGDQRTAFAYANEAAARQKAESQAVIKAEEAEQANFDEMYGRQPQSAKLSMLASGDPRLYSRLGVTDPTQVESMAAEAQQAMDSDLIKRKFEADKVRAGLDTSVGTQDVKATGQQLVGLGFKYANDGNREAEVAEREGINALVAAEAAQIMAQARKGGGTMSQAQANQAAIESLGEQGVLKVHISDGSDRFWGENTEDEGTPVISLGNPGAKLAPTPAQAQATQAPTQMRRIVLQ